MLDVNIRTIGPDNVMTFEFSKTKSFLSGKERVAQKFAKTILTTRGTQIFLPNYGANILDYVPKILSSDGRNQEARLGVSKAISAAEQQLVRSQVSLDLPDNEVLISADLIEIRIDSTSGNVEVDVRITTLSDTFTHTITVQ